MAGLPRDKKGSNLVYVVVLIALLGVLAGAYSLAVVSNAKAAAKQRQYQADRYAAKSLLTALTDSVIAGQNPAVSGLTAEAREGYLLYFAEKAKWSAMPEELQHGSPAPKFADYLAEHYETEGTTPMEEGSITVALTFFPEEDGGGQLELSIHILLNGREFALGARLKGLPGQPNETGLPAPISDWSVTSWYEE